MLVCRNCVLMQKLVVSIKCDGVVRRLKLLAQLWTVFHNMDHYKKLILLSASHIEQLHILRTADKKCDDSKPFFPLVKSTLLNEKIITAF